MTDSDISPLRWVPSCHPLDLTRPLLYPIPYPRTHYPGAVRCGGIPSVCQERPRPSLPDAGDGAQGPRERVAPCAPAAATGAMKRGASAGADVK
jgi:hypothetical protein